MGWILRNKTYVSAVLIGTVVALHAAGLIDDATYQMLLGLLGAGALGAVRHAISKVQR